MFSTRVGTKGSSTRTAVLVLCFFFTSSAPAADGVRAQEPPTSDKASLIKELVELTNARGNAEAIMNAVIGEVRKERERLFELAISELGPLSQKEREDLIRKKGEDESRLDERVMELFRQKIDLGKVVDEVSHALFDKYYTAEELRDLIAFYKTPTGQKSIKIMPQLFADSMAETGKRLLPQLEPIMKQVIEEERLRIENILPPKPRPKRAPKRRG